MKDITIEIPLPSIILSALRRARRTEVRAVAVGTPTRHPLSGIGALGHEAQRVDLYVGGVRTIHWINAVAGEEWARARGVSMDSRDERDAAIRRGCEAHVADTHFQMARRVYVGPSLRGLWIAIRRRPIARQLDSATPVRAWLRPSVEHHST